MGSINRNIMEKPRYNGHSSQEFIKPTTKFKDSEFIFHPLSTMNKDNHVGFNINSSGKSYSPQFCGVSSNVASDRHQINVEDYRENNSTDSDITINYIHKILMQEDIDDRVSSYHGDTALRAMEEPFYTLLGQHYPVLPQVLPVCSCNQLMNISDSINKSSDQPCSRCSGNYHPNDNFQASQAPWNLSAIVGEAHRSIPGIQRMETGLNIKHLSITEKPSQDYHPLQMNSLLTSEYASSELRGRKSYPRTEDFDLLEGKSNKQLAISSNEPIRNEMFDKVLLCSDDKPVDDATILQQTMASNDISIRDTQNDQGRTRTQRKARGKGRQKKEVVDLTTLLINCAQAVAVNNRTLASDILKTTRLHSSPSGDDTQRLALCLADCLEERLAGTGSQAYQRMMTKRRNAEDMMKVLNLGCMVCPFLKAAYYFSTKTILNVSKGEQRVHIIDFGVCFGFQWPSLFEQFGSREDGPPKLRITGIELPKRGFRPSGTDSNTQLRLTHYASMFNVTFEYRQIASKWEAISVEDLNIQQDEALIVNCIYRMENIGDETVSINSARNKVLNTIRSMKPKVFVHGVMNGSYSTPFFLTRFKEVMYQYAALFDILDKTVPRDDETRMYVEREIYQSAILNVVACEGSERIERPERYKKWKARNLKAGLEQVPLNLSIVKGTQDMVRRGYHRDLFVDQEDQWLVLGWKGRIIYALSTWKANESHDGD